MSRITLAKTAGFCFGVNRAVNMRRSLLTDNPVELCHKRTGGVRVGNPPFLQQVCHRLLHSINMV